MGLWQLDFCHNPRFDNASEAGAATTPVSATRGARREARTPRQQKAAPCEREGRPIEAGYSVKYATPPSMSGWYALPGTFL